MVANGCYLTNPVFFINTLLFFNLTFPPSLSHAQAWLPSLSPRIVVHPRSTREQAAQQSSVGSTDTELHEIHGATTALRGHQALVWHGWSIPWCHLQHHQTGMWLVWICPLLVNLVVLQRLPLMAGDVECAAHSMGLGSPLLSYRVKLLEISCITDLLSPLHFVIKD